MKLQLTLDKDDVPETCAAAIVAGLLTGFLRNPTLDAEIQAICAARGYPEGHADKVLGTVTAVRAYFLQAARLDDLIDTKGPLQ